MCTATYLPSKDSGFIVTHSRDEKALRPAARPPRAFQIGDRQVTYPQDPQGQGTWIATSDDTTVCLLNGAFTAHQPQPPYKHSRGLVIPDFFTYSSIKSFECSYDFAGIEPFTLLVIQEGRLIEFRWTGKRLVTHEKDPHRPHIWSSVTLYSPNVIEQRETWFSNWLAQHPSPSLTDIRSFHQTAGDGNPEHSLRMSRRIGDSDIALLTLSLTSVVNLDEQVEMIYDDFILNHSTRQFIGSSYAVA